MFGICISFAMNTQPPDRRNQNICRRLWMDIIFTFSTLATAAWIWFWAGPHRSYMPEIRHPLIWTGLLLWILCSAYGGLELQRLLYKRPAVTFLPTSALMVVIAFMSGLLLVANGLRLQARPALSRFPEPLLLRETLHP